MAFFRFLAYMLGASLIAAVTFRFLHLRLLRDPALPAPWERRLRRVLIALSALLPLGMLQLLNFRECPRFLAAPLMWLAFSWVGVLLFLLAALLLFELPLRVAHHLAPTRRMFFSRAAAITAGLFAASCSAMGLHTTLSGFIVRRVRLPVRNLPARPAGKPYVLVQLSDLHISAQIGGDFVREVVARTNELHPDGIVITGDLVDGGIPELAPHIEPLRDLRAPDGVFAVTGNHEYLSGAEEWVAHFRSLGMRVLRNELVSLPAFQLAGIDDDVGPEWLADHGPDLSTALAGRDPQRPVILLAHRPTQLPHASKYDVDLQLSGHTHGGQIRPLDVLEAPYVFGLYQLGKTTLYVSPGTGYWGPPMRLGTRAEITVLELYPEETAHT